MIPVDQQNVWLKAIVLMIAGTLAGVVATHSQHGTQITSLHSDMLDVKRSLIRIEGKLPKQD